MKDITLPAPAAPDAARLHTTPLGAVRIARSLGLAPEEAEAWCRRAAQSPEAHAARRGKNWYITAQGCTLTVHAGSLTIITAHPCKAEKE